MITVALGDHGAITHVIDDTGRCYRDASSRDPEGNQLPVNHTRSHREAGLQPTRGLTCYFIQNKKRWCDEARTIQAR
jgi:hypothetical protein